MPLGALLTKSKIWEGTNIGTLARVTGDDRSALQQSGVTSIALSVHDLTADDTETAIYTSAPVVSATIFDTLQLSDDWDQDDVGFNFSDTVSGSDFTQEGGHIYRLEYKLTTVSFGVIPVVHEVTVLGLHS